MKYFFHYRTGAGEKKMRAPMQKRHAPAGMPFLFFISGVVSGVKTENGILRSLRMPAKSGADEGNRTLYIQLGKLTFYR